MQLLRVARANGHHASRESLAPGLNSKPFTFYVQTLLSLDGPRLSSVLFFSKHYFKSYSINTDTFIHQLIHIYFVNLQSYPPFFFLKKKHTLSNNPIESVPYLKCHTSHRSHVKANVHDARNQSELLFHGPRNI